MKKDHQVSGKGTVLMGCENRAGQFLLRLRIETDDMSPYQRDVQFPIYQTGMRQLLRIFEVLQDEAAVNQDCLKTSFVDVEMEIAKCISGLLQDVDKQIGSTEAILTLLRDYKVVRPLGQKNQSVSLLTIHSILQDNFPNSLLCKILNITCAGFYGLTTKVIYY